MHGEGNICLGFLFGRKAKIAYLSDVSRFLPETEYGMIFLPTIVYLQIYAWQKWYFIELMFKVMVISEIIMIYMNAENQNNLQVVWIIAKPVSLFFLLYNLANWKIKSFGLSIDFFYWTAILDVVLLKQVISYLASILCEIVPVCNNTLQ